MFCPSRVVILVVTLTFDRKHLNSSILLIPLTMNVGVEFELLLELLLLVVVLPIINNS